MMIKGVCQFTFFLLTGILCGFVFFSPSSGSCSFEQLKGSKNIPPWHGPHETVNTSERGIESLYAELNTEDSDGAALLKKASDLNGDLNNRLNRVEESVVQSDEDSGLAEPVREINTPVSRESESSAEEFKQWVESISGEMDDNESQSRNGSGDNLLDDSGESSVP